MEAQLQSRVFVVRVWRGSQRFHATVRDVTSDEIAEFSDRSAMLEFMTSAYIAQTLDSKPLAPLPSAPLSAIGDIPEIDKKQNE